MMPVRPYRKPNQYRRRQARRAVLYLGAAIGLLTIGALLPVVAAMPALLASAAFDVVAGRAFERAAGAHVIGRVRAW